MTLVPTWDTFMAPSLRAALGGRTWRARDIREAAARELGLGDEARAEQIPSGQLRWENRALWALSYLARSGALERPARGSYRITDAGRALASEHPGALTERDLRAFIGRPDAPHTSAALREIEAETPARAVEDELDPIEAIEHAVEQVNQAVAAELIERLHAQEPAFFEKAVLTTL